MLTRGRAKSIVAETGRSPFLIPRRKKAADRCFSPKQRLLPWVVEKLVLYKPCLHPDSVARCPPLEKGGQGGYPRVTTAWFAVPRRLSSAELSHRPNVLAMPFNPPCPPFSRGGRTDDWRNKNTRLESALRAQ